MKKTLLFLFLFLILAVPQASADSLVGLLNAQRASAGEAPLTENATLDTSAQTKANDLCTQGYWSHTNPQGVTFDQFITNAGYNYLYAGENLARAYTTDTDMVNAWMASTGHRENILNSNYREIGVGRCKWYVVTHFGTQKGQGEPAPIVQQANAQAAENMPVIVADVEKPVDKIQTQKLLCELPACFTRDQACY